jgi:hypothetical protein
MSLISRNKVLPRLIMMIRLFPINLRKFTLNLNPTFEYNVKIIMKEEFFG